MLPVVPLNGQSTIPTNLPLESIAARVVVPRDIHREAYAVVETHSALPPQPTELDERVTVPIGAAPPMIIEPAAGPAPDIVNPDVFLTGEVNFVLRAAMQGKTPYFERGVTARLWPDDGSARFRDFFDRARSGPVLLKE